MCLWTLKSPVSFLLSFSEMAPKRKYVATGDRFYGGSYPGVGSALVPVYKRPRRDPPRRPAPVRMGARVGPRLKSGRSYTRTATKRRRKMPKIYSHGDNSSFSYNTIVGRSNLRSLRAIAKRVVNPQTVRANGASNWSVGYGVQSVNILGFMSKSQLVAIKTAANGGVATDNNLKLFLKSGLMRVNFRNTANTNMRCTIYDCVTRRTPPSSALDAPSEVWAKGMTDFSVTGTYSTVGMTPFKSPEFREYFRVNKATTVSLEPGQEHQHTVYHKWNKIVNSTHFDNAPGEAVAGLTRYFMLVWHGTLGHEALDEGTVTTSSGKLDYMFTSQYSYGFIQEVLPSFTNTNTLDTTITTFQFMGESGDADTAIVAA